MLLLLTLLLLKFLLLTLLLLKRLLLKLLLLKLLLLKLLLLRLLLLKLLLLTLLLLTLLARLVAVFPWMSLLSPAWSPTRLPRFCSSEFKSTTEAPGRPSIQKSVRLSHNCSTNFESRGSFPSTKNLAITNITPPHESANIPPPLCIPTSLYTPFDSARPAPDTDSSVPINVSRPDT